ncbi:TetR/AcrR family transcriptional regulator [Kribbella sp. NPDC051770]|uniref:TetR/AcrR family transcriptional regulator n=1 Tax=Kribbella sp. NPDC051770 TaxID=3155413 RepID=UPI003423A48B
MSALKDRRDRERAERHQLIVTTARDLAEAEGWSAVTTRRLAEKVEYSQPVLYSHFAGKEAIQQAVALEGFTELADQLSAAARDAAAPKRRDATSPAAASRSALRAICETYLDFAAQHPALYQAMFILPTQLTFASPATPPALRAGFDAFVNALPGGTEQPEVVAEILWSALHGIVALSAGGRLRVEDQRVRLDVLLAYFAPEK